MKWIGKSEEKSNLWLRLDRDILFETRPSDEMTERSGRVLGCVEYECEERKCRSNT